jgi:hypothetical protein
MHIARMTRYANPAIFTATRDPRLSPTIILDTGANINIVNRRELLSKPKQVAGVSIKGVGDADITPHLEGTLGPFGKAYFVPTSTFNILSFKKMSELFHLKYYQDSVGDQFDLHDKKTRSIVARFEANDEGMYTLVGTENDDVNDILTNLTKYKPFTTPKRSTVQRAANILATDDSDTEDDSDDEIAQRVNPRRVSAADRTRAVEAMRLHEMLNHPNDEALKTLLDNGAIRGCNLRGDDVNLGRLIEGPCSTCKRAKATLKKPKPHEDSTQSPYVGHTIHADICFLKSKPCLRLCEDITNYSALIPIKSKDKASIMDALATWFGQMLAHTGNAVRRLRTDNEATFSALTNDLAKQGILLQQSPSGQHSGKVERATRTDRDGLRTLLQDLPYQVPENLQTLAAIDVVKMRNLIPNKSNTSPPFTLVTGRKPTVDDIAAPWGSIVLATNPNVPSDKTKPKAELGIIVGHNFDTRAGSVDILIVDPTKTSSTKIVNRPSRLIAPASAADIAIAKAFVGELCKRSPGLSIDDIIKYHIEPYEEAPPTAMPPVAYEPIEQGPLAVPTVTHESITPVPQLEQQREEPTVHPDQTHAADTSQDTVNDASVTDDQAATAETDGINQEYAKPHGYDLRATRRTPARFIGNIKVNYALNLSVKRATATYGDAATDAIKQELNQLVAKQTWIPIKSAKTNRRSKHQNVLPCSMFLKEKFGASGAFDKIKARLVAGGHRTDPNSYLTGEKSSLTAKHESVMAMLALAAKQQLSIETLDFPGAYLHGKLANRHVMRLPRKLVEILVQEHREYLPYQQPDGTVLVQLKGALYGLPEAGKLWNERLNASLVKMGYERNTDDPCLYKKTEDENVSYISLHVDDVLHTFSCESLRAKLHQSLQEEYGELTKHSLNEKNEISYLGMSLKRTMTTCADGQRRAGITITMPKFLEECLVDGNIRGSSKTPATADLFTVDDAEPTGCPRAFLAKVMKVMYLARKCRYDVLLPISFLATRAKAPTKQDWDKLARYLNATRNLPLVIAPDDLQLRAFMDASFAVHPGAKGQSGRIISLGNIGGPLTVKTSKQTLVAKSSTESELICLADGVSEVLQLQRILKFLGLNPHPAIIFQDNLSTKYMAETGRGGKQGNSKHIDVRYFFVKQHIDCGDLKIEHLPTDDMTADFLKPWWGINFTSYVQN